MFGMPSKLLPVAAQLGAMIKEGLDHYADLRASGIAVNPDLIAIFLRQKLDKWDPEVGGRKLLDAPTREAGARFLAGIVVNVSR